MNTQTVVKRSGLRVALDMDKIAATIARACRGVEESVSVQQILNEFQRIMYDGLKTEEIEQALILAATAFIERDPAYSLVATRLLWQKVYKTVFNRSVAEQDFAQCY